MTNDVADKPRPKQVIIMRTKFPIPGDARLRGVRKGKLVAQGAHASLGALLDRGEWTENGDYLLKLTPAMKDWMDGRFAKIAVKVESEQELLELHAAAVAANLPSALIRDSGRTEFHGKPTYTAVAIGPAYPDEIDPITGHLTPM
ncbi:MAG: aminoacyl-tRNA hydrolase [Myxococcota bacterium]|nr:aminoacyl-tRNA hydrolase [Myxococcota bacterium]